MSAQHESSELAGQSYRERAAAAAGMLRASATGARWVDEGQTKFILVPKVTVDRVLRLLEEVER